MKNWFQYFARTIRQPWATALSILGEKDAVGLGLLYTVGFSFLYSLTSLLLYWRGNLPQGALLPIQPQRWYLYQTFSTISVGFASIALLAVIAHGLARRLGGTGRWQDSWYFNKWTTAYTGLVIAIPGFLFCIPTLGAYASLIGTLFGTVWFILMGRDFIRSGWVRSTAID
ncbi:MAG TPA: hypothetical protein VMS73_10070 [Anaerolineaceae bacterium]|nr:hypothetical protein [Anaerolineaceae bacterium]